MGRWLEDGMLAHWGLGWGFGRSRCDGCEGERRDLGCSSDPTDLAHHVVVFNLEWVDSMNDSLIVPEVSETILLQDVV